MGTTGFILLLVFAGTAYGRFENEPEGFADEYIDEGLIDDDHEITEAGQSIEDATREEQMNDVDQASDQALSKECYSSHVKSCKISPPSLASDECKEIRKNELKKKKLFYKLKPVNRNPGPTELQVPVLDQPPDKILQHSMTDPFTAHHFNMLFIAFGKTLKEKIVPAALANFARKDMTTYKDYFEVTEFFKRALKLNESTSRYFRVPSAGYPYFTDIVSDLKFTKDRYFVQERLAGVNPMSIQRVTLQGDIGVNWKTLAEKLNSKFEWENAVKKITGKDLTTSINENMVYVLEYPMLEGLETVPDILQGKTNKPAGAKMLGHVNPIAIFATKFNPRKKKYTMKPVAIQVDSKKDAEVFTPKDGFNWEIAKARVQSADFLFSQIHEHLLRTHFRMETVCVCLYRHLSQLHPLHEILKYHCRGLFPLNANGTIVLLSPGKYAHALFPVGHLGAFKLLQKGYDKMVWNDFGIANVRRRGMDDREKVPYYPYRDDGRQLDKAFKEFGKELVSVFYEDDDAVLQDAELQNMINELSVNGKQPPFNGLGNVKGLPGKFKNREQVAMFIAEVLWIQVQHSVISFTPGVWGTQTPLYPTKLYSDPRAKEKNDFVYMLPGALAACMQAGLSHTVGALQYDVMFDYSDDIRDDDLKQLVGDTYDHFMCALKNKLDNRNSRRFNRGYLTNPFMVPGWMPNSIST